MFHHLLRCVVLLTLYQIVLHRILLYHIMVLNVYFHLLCCAWFYCTVCRDKTWHHTIKQSISHSTMFHMATLQL